MHQAITDRLEIRPEFGLRDTGFAGRNAQIAVKGRYGYLRDQCWTPGLGTPIDVELPDIEPVSRRHCRRKERRRAARTIQIASDESELEAIVYIDIFTSLWEFYVPLA